MITRGLMSHRDSPSEHADWTAQHLCSSIAERAVLFWLVFSLAIAFPTLEVLGAAPEFFVAHRLAGTRLVLYAALLVVVFPLITVGVLAGIAALKPRGGLIVMEAAAATLIAVWGIQTFHGSINLRLPYALVLSLAVSIVFMYVFRRSPALRSYVRFGLLAPGAVVLWFLLASEASALLNPEATGIADVEVGNPVPVAFVVFDELSTISLMSPEGTIDSLHFPTFSRLAREGTWYREATTVEGFTRYAIPAILSGRSSDDRDPLPTARDHPENIFTLLGGTYRIVRSEPITELCPATVCDHSDRRTADWSLVLSDTAIVFGHRTAPGIASRWLPSVDDQWAGFRDDDGRSHADHGEDSLTDGDALHERAIAAVNAERPDLFRAVVERVDNSETPTLYFIHSLLTHRPWRHLSDGRIYQPGQAGVPGLEDGRWTDEWLAIQGQQRHLMQVGYADQLLGELVEALESNGLYDDALIIVTSDHGLSFEPERHSRHADATTLPEIAAVPLLVKYPNQVEGGTSDLPAQLIDLLPTVADVLDIAMPWPTDGRSLLDEDQDEERIRTFRSRMERFEIKADEASPWRALPTKLERFPSTGDGHLYTIGPYREMVAQPVADVNVDAESADIAVDLVGADQYSDFTHSAAHVPVQVRGRLVGNLAASDERWVAIAVNGTIGTVVRTFDRDGPYFAGLVPPEHFVEGRNEVAVYVLEGPERVPVLRLAPPS
jgi:hypothetical protein